MSDTYRLDLHVFDILLRVTERYGMTNDVNMASGADVSVLKVGHGCTKLESREFEFRIFTKSDIGDYI